MTKRLYERLGVVGKKLAFKGCPEQFVIHIPLQRETASVAVRERQRTALKTWDSIRAESGLGKWEVAYVGGGGGVVEVKARLRHDTDVYIPDPELPESADESVEDRQQRLGSLFEWAGMACLGAQRLKANDRVDPYVAVYEAPSPSRIGNTTHVRWRGLMDGGFVQSISLIEGSRSIVSTSQPDDDSSSSISIIMHSNVTGPVSYIPSSAPGVSEASDREAPLRVPSREAEDTSCLIVSCTSGRPTWALGQSIGKWDARWG
ncbi:hypothetical protein BU15DRAFT_45598 [Melanogaster broomeanus]|nr:hypothetical protein BU15DRAFT_45598 [Melanogaster broomeanus]